MRATIEQRGAKRRLIRFGKIALAVLFLAEILYVVVANAFLNLGGVQKVLSSTEDIRASFSRAWTVVPGEVHVENLRLLFHDHNLEWSLDLREVSFRVSFLPFLSKTFRAHHVRGSGAVFRMRQRVARNDAWLASTKALPPIPEFETPALFIYTVPPPPTTELWTVHLSDVDVIVSELWVEQFRYQGSGRARGAFRLHAGYHLWVGPASLDLDPGELTASHRLISPRFGGHVECIAHPFFVNEPEGRDVFRYLSTRVNLHGDDLRLGPFDLFLPDRTRLGAPGSALDIDVATDHGVFTPDSRVRFHGPELAVTVSGWQATAGNFELRTRTLDAGFGEATFSAQRGALRRAAEVGARATAGSVAAAIGNDSLDTTADWSVSHVDFALTGGRVSDLRRIDALTRPAGLALLGGGAELEVSGRHARGELSGRAELELHRAHGRVRAVDGQIDGRVTVSVGRARTEAWSDGNVDVAVDARRIAVGRSTFRVAALEAKLDAHARIVDGRGAGTAHASSRTLEATDGKATVHGEPELDLTLSGIDVRARRADAKLVATLGALRASGGSLRASSGKITVRSELALRRGHSLDGFVQVSAPASALHSGGSRFHADTELLVDAQAFDPVDRKGSAKALLLIRDFSMVDAVHGAGCQWASVPQATVRAKVDFASEHAPELSVSADLERARGQWDDFSMGSNVHVEARYRDRSSDPIALVLDANHLELRSGDTNDEGWQARVDKARLVSGLRKDLNQLSGRVRVQADDIEGRIGKTSVHGTVAVDWKLAFLDLQQRKAIGSGEIWIDDAGLEAGALRVHDWWGRVHVPLAQIDVARNVELFGNFDAKLRDGLPALAIFAADGDLPSWVPSVLPLRALEARGEFEKRCRTTQIAIERARGGPLAAAGRIQSEPSAVRAAFLVQLRVPLPISAGLSSYRDDVGVKLFAGNSWLAEQSTKLDQFALVARCEPAPERCTKERTQSPQRAIAPRSDHRSGEVSSDFAWHGD